MVYFDNAATTKPYEAVLKTFNECGADEYFNPSASYSLSFNLYKKIGDIRKKFISILNGDVESDNIVFTSSATESNNLAIFGSCFNKEKKYLFSVGEHPAVYNCAMELKNKGYKVFFIPLQKNGQVDYDKLDNLCDNDVCFVSTMFVNNETGAINDLIRIRNIIDKKAKNCVFHVDGVQGFCKIPIDVTEARINLFSISAHKIHGLKGLGALYISKGTKLKNIIFGGGQEFGLRSGTINYPGIISFYKAAQTTCENMKKNFVKVTNLKNYLREQLVKLNKNKIRIVSDNECSPYINSLIFEGNRGETIMRFLDSKGILVGTGSACSSSKVGNRVLENMGFNKNQILGSIRISFSADNTKGEIDYFITCIDDYLKNINA